MSPAYQDRLVVLVDHYQRATCASLLTAKAAHDVAFSMSATLEDHAKASIEAMEALQAAQQALVAIRSLLNTPDPDIPAGPCMAAPILILN